MNGGKFSIFKPKRAKARLSGLLSPALKMAEQKGKIMSTHANIRILKDGKETGIYCHSDGYIEYTGVILQLYYSTPEKAQELIDLGNLSYLAETLETTCAYHRDRNESFYQTLQEEEYIYTYDCYDNAWYVDYVTSPYPATNIMKYLRMEYCDYRRKTLLLEAISEKEESVKNAWDKQDIIDDCMKAARNAREEIIEEKDREFMAYYHAYCD